MESARKFVLVGVDGAPESQIALRWAISAAKGRGAPVRVLRAYLDHSIEWPAAGAEEYVAESQAARNQAELDATVDFVRGQLGEENGSGWLTSFPAADAILAEAPDAELIVLGSTIHSKLGAVLLGSVATAVTAKAPCPVVVVRGSSEGGPVLVGTDGSGDSDAAVMFGFEEAARSGSDLQVVYCRQAHDHHEAPSAGADELLRNWLAESLAPHRNKYPGVRVKAEVVAGHPAVVLADRSSGSSLVVVGSRGRGGVTGLLLGSVSQNLLRHANCPVAVVRPAAGER
jgi:nucleotide-binding universal stress UspA family protein